MSRNVHVIGVVGLRSGEFQHNPNTVTRNASNMEIRVNTLQHSKSGSKTTPEKEEKVCSCKWNIKRDVLKPGTRLIYEKWGRQVENLREVYKGRDPKCSIHGNLSPFWKDRKVKGYIDV